MENLFKDIPSVSSVYTWITYLIQVKLTVNILATLEALLQRLVFVSRKRFMVSSVTYLGFQIDAKGLHITEKIRMLLSHLISQL